MTASASALAVSYCPFASKMQMAKGEEREGSGQRERRKGRMKGKGE